MLQGQMAEAQLDFDRCLKLDRSLEPVVRERIEATRRQLAPKH
jgi:hypothetical protein